MPLPSHQELLNPLLDALRAKGGVLSIPDQEATVGGLLNLSADQLTEMQSENRTKFNYRLAWARNYLKRLGLVENVDKGVWRLTEKGMKEKLVSPDALRELARSLADNESLGTGVEPEDIDSHIVKPFDPTLIRVESKPATLGQLISRIEHDEIDLAPAFQRKAGIWNDGAQSRLIESLLVRIPIPAFYFDASDEDKWIVVDGLQRLTTLKRFVLDGSLRLQGMEFLHGMEGMSFDQVPRSLQRRISETGVTVFLIEKNTPSVVKFNIFKRINTGGLPLSTQEIRHALNQGKVTELLESLASSEAFRIATDYGIRDERMADRECVLRFLAFTISSPAEFKASDFDAFLSDKMAELNSFSDAEFTRLRQDFFKAMVAAHAIFGRNAFRKPYRLYRRRMPINKALFEAWSVNLGKVSAADVSRLVAKRDIVDQRFAELCLQPEFVGAVSQGTGDPLKVRRRFGGIQKLLAEVLT